MLAFTPARQDGDIRLFYADKEGQVHSVTLEGDDRLTQTQLVLLARHDVDERSRHHGRAPVGAALDDAATELQPAPFARFCPATRFQFEGRCFSDTMAFDRGAYPRQVVGMDVVSPFFAACGHFPRRIAHHRLETERDGNTAFAQIPIPVPLLRPVQNTPQSPVPFDSFHLFPFTFGDGVESGDEVAGMETIRRNREPGVAGGEVALATHRVAAFGNLVENSQQIFVLAA